jgi:hypothetical protein
MKIFIILFSLFILSVAGFMALRPKQFTETLLKLSDTVWLHVGAAGVRIVIGIALILYADQSRFPLTLHILGWIAVVAGVIFALVPRAKFIRLMHWAFERFARYTRIAAVFAVLFAGFLIYAVL